jgi:NADPH2:quinone reductase
MSMQTSKEIRSTVTSEGIIEISIANVPMPVPSESEVLIKVEAAPINPSDLALLVSFAADLDSAQFSKEDQISKATIKIRPGLMNALKGRVGQPMPAGNEGAGIVIGAGEKAKALIGKTVGVAGGSMYSQYRCAPASSCLVMDEGISSIEAASSFVNPLTALAFVETMKMENHTAMVNTAAASNLGQMLVKICKDDGIPLVNIVRKPAQVKILQDLGAE